MAEHVGTWASQYGGVAVHVRGIDPARAGTYLERHLYAPDERDKALLVGVRAVDTRLDAAALRRVDAYYSKNPALVQREVADISARSSTGNRFRLTARSVFNPANAPDAFELRALDAMRDGDRREYVEVAQGELRYARSIVAEPSCVACHGSRETAPRFLLTNASFTGGGFGYVAGRPAAVLSVHVRLPATGEALAASFSPRAWGALGALVGVLVLLLGFTAARVIAPVNRLRRHAETLSNSPTALLADDPAADDVDPDSRNEIHRLALAISALSESVRVLLERARRR
jgi:HAMP domain-containing protein/mono/diheme cytochrome c family protein